MNRMFGFRRRAKERGAAILLVAGSMVALVGMTAFAVDIGRTMVVRGELQNVADAAALAGGSRIGNFFEQDWVAACDAAEAAVTENRTEGSLMALGDADIETGVWSDTLKTFTPLASCSGTLVNADDIPVDSFPAIRVVMHRDAGSVSGPISMFFAPVIGTNEIEITAEAVAVIATASSAKRALPFAISDCSLRSALDSDGKPVIGHEFTTVSAHFAAADTPPDPDDPEDLGTCIEKGQWTGLCGVISGGCNGSGDVKKILNGQDDPTLHEFIELTNLDPGMRTGLYGDANKILISEQNKKSGEVVDTFIVPVVAAEDLGKDGERIAEVVNFIAVELVAIDAKLGGGPDGEKELSFTFRIIDPLLIRGSTPNVENQFAGVITNATLVN